MPYPGQFYRIVAIGTIYDDVFNMTCAMVPTALGEISIPESSEAFAEDVAGVWAAWWQNGTAGQAPAITSDAILRSVKVNRVGPDGRYVDNEVYEHVLDVPRAGASSLDLPAQLAVAATLRTAVTRGRGSKGRMYLPPCNAITSVGTDGRMTAIAATNLASSVAHLVNELNNQALAIARVGVASNAGTGRFEHVTSISVGRVVDTIRSRRSALDEDPQTVAL